MVEQSTTGSYHLFHEHATLAERRRDARMAQPHEAAACCSSSWGAISGGSRAVDGDYEVLVRLSRGREPPAAHDRGWRRLGSRPRAGCHTRWRGWRRRGWVRRESCPSDRRGSSLLTEEVRRWSTPRRGTSKRAGEPVRPPHGRSGEAPRRDPGHAAGWLEATVEGRRRAALDGRAAGDL